MTGSDTVAILMALLAAVLIAPAQGAPPTGQLVCVGDSITAGAHVTPDECYVGRLRARAAAEHVDLDVVGDGRSGWTTGAFAHNAQAIAARVPVGTTVVTVLLGTNNCRSHDPAARVGSQAAADLVRLIGAYRARIPRAEFVLVAPPAVDLTHLTPELVKADYGPQSPAALRAIRDAYRSTAARLGLRFVDLSTLPLAGHLPDGVHPDPVGHGKIADAIWARLSAPAPTTMAR